MSASLVGSEMCIRDRLPGQVCAPSFGAASTALGRLRRAGRHTSTLETVSYTHLTLPTICSV
eukprot:394950-Alexandrium_andersonii.AAC.1